MYSQASTGERNPLTSGQVLADRYEILEFIGEGGQGGVYKAKDLNLGRTIALKIFHCDYLDDKDIARRFSHEAEIAGQINHHNVVKVFDHGICKELQLVYIAMDYVSGHSLAKLVEQQGQLNVERSINILIQLCAGIAAADNQKHVVHRDIKPGNILLADEANNPDLVKITDFGIARVIQESEELKQYTRTGIQQPKGTSPYMSPEQCALSELDRRSDIYSMGCVLFQLLTGNPPYTGHSDEVIRYKHVHEKIPRLVLPSEPLIIRLRLDKILHKALAKAPEDRYQNAKELQHDLESVQMLLSQLKSGQANAIVVALESIWLSLSSVLRVLRGLFSLDLFSKQKGSTKIKLGKVLGLSCLAVVSIVALMVIYSLFFSSPPDANISNRELPLKPIIDSSIKLQEADTGDVSSARQPPSIEQAIKSFQQGNLNKAAGRYDAAEACYLRAEKTFDALKIANSVQLADILNAHAENKLWTNLATGSASQFQDEQSVIKENKFELLVAPETLRSMGLSLSTNAASARNYSLGTLTVMKKLGHREDTPEELLALGLLALSFQELGETGQAQGDYDKFYHILFNTNLSPELDKLPLALVLTSAGRFYLEHKQSEKAQKVLMLAQPCLSELGIIARYNLATTYNDLGLAREIDGASNEALVLFKQAYFFLVASGKNVIEYRAIVLDNIASAAFKVGDFKTVLQSRLEALTGFTK